MGKYCRCSVNQLKNSPNLARRCGYAFAKVTQYFEKITEFVRMEGGGGMKISLLFHKQPIKGFLKLSL